MLKDMITASEAEKIAHVTRHTITSACKAGEIDGAVMFNKMWVMPRASVLAWVRSGRRKMGRPRNPPESEPDDAKS